MGAELNLPSTYKNVERYLPQFIKYSTKRDHSRNGRQAYYQERVDEYFDKMFGGGSFQDLYNESNLLWRLGLDYSTWLRSFLDDENLLHPDKAALVLEEIQGRHHVLEGLGDKNEQEYFEQRFREVTEILRTAISTGEPIQCSI